MSRKQIAYLVLVIIIAAGSALFGAAGGALAVYQLGRLRQVSAQQSTKTTVSIPKETVTQNSPTESILVSNKDVETTITQVVQQVGPAVVTVVGTTQAQMTPFGFTSEGEVSGSGVFISQEGYILTNNHVVENTSQLSIILADGTRQEAQLVGTDIYADLAVLKAQGPAPAVATLGNSDALDPGETVIAIGSPLGDFKNSVTVGVVSATGRSIDTGEGYLIEGLIQTDAAINQGNSGGPLVSLAGEVIGINTLVVRSSNSGAVAEGLGFAIPSNTIQAVAGQIIQTGHFSRPYLGIKYQSISPYLASRYRLPVEYGVYVTGVESKSPADQADIKTDDIIYKIGDVVLDETHTYINTLFQYEPGETVTIGLIRDGKRMEAQVVLGAS